MITTRDACNAAPTALQALTKNIALSHVGVDDKLVAVSSSEPV